MNKFIAFFAVLFVTDVLFAIFTPTLTYISKPLIISALLGYYIVSVEKQNKWYIFFLIFEMLSQVFFVFWKDDISLSFSKAATIVSSLCFMGLVYPAFKGFKQFPQKILFTLSVVLFISQLFMYYSLIHFSQPLVYLTTLALFGSVVLGLGISQRYPALGGVSYISWGILLFAISKLIIAEGDINLRNFIGFTMYSGGNLLIALGLIKTYRKAREAYEKANNLQPSKR